MKCSTLLVAMVLIDAACTPSGAPSTDSAQESGSPRALRPSLSDASAGEGSQSAASSIAARWVAARPPTGTAVLSWPARVLGTESAQAAVTAPFAGRIVRCFARPGSEVAKGAPLVELVVPQVAEAAAAVVAANVRLEAYGARQQQLRALKAEGLARIDELADVDMKVAEVRADIVRAEAVLRVAGAAREQAAALAASGGVVALRAPLAGVVTELNAPLGESREPGSAPLARVVGRGALRVEARIPAPLPASLPVSYSFADSGGRAVPLTWVGLSPIADPRDGLRAVWFDPAQPSDELIPQAPGVVTARLGAGAAAVLVPARAVGRRAGRAFVRRQAGPNGEDVVVELFVLSGGEALIGGALKVGELVAAEAPSAAAEAPSAAAGSGEDGGALP